MQQSRLTDRVGPSADASNKSTSINIHESRADSPIVWDPLLILQTKLPMLGPVLGPMFALWAALWAQIGPYRALYRALYGALYRPHGPYRALIGPYFGSSLCVGCLFCKLGLTKKQWIDEEAPDWDDADPLAAQRIEKETTDWQ